MRVTLPAPDDIGDVIGGRCRHAHLRTAGEIASKTGLAERTLQRRFSEGGWELTELQIIHRYVHFTAAEALELLEGTKT